MDAKYLSLHQLSLRLTGLKTLPQTHLPVLTQQLKAVFSEQTMEDFLDACVALQPKSDPSLGELLNRYPKAWDIAEAIILFWYNGMSPDHPPSRSIPLYEESAVWALLGATPPGISQSKSWQEPPT